MYIRASIFIVLILVYSSCCPFVKEEHLGKNLFLSEYDNVDRRILYSTTRCSGSGVEIVPMTVLEVAYDDHWIIAKSGTEKGDNYQYWIIDKMFVADNDSASGSVVDVIKAHVFTLPDSTTFSEYVKRRKIDLVLKKI